VAAVETGHVISIVKGRAFVTATTEFFHIVEDLAKIPPLGSIRNGTIST
jgi:hypothetical protein